MDSSTIRLTCDPQRTASQVFLAFADRLRRLDPEEAERVLEIAEVDHEDVVRWHTDLDELMAEED